MHLGARTTTVPRRPALLVPATDDGGCVFHCCPSSAARWWAPPTPPCPPRAEAERPRRHREAYCSIRAALFPSRLLHAREKPLGRRRPLLLPEKRRKRPPARRRVVRSTSGGRLSLRSDPVVMAASGPPGRSMGHRRPGSVVAEQLGRSLGGRRVAGASWCRSDPAAAPPSWSALAHQSQQPSWRPTGGPLDRSHGLECPSR